MHPLSLSSSCFPGALALVRARDTPPFGIFKREIEQCFEREGERERIEFGRF